MDNFNEEEYNGKIVHIIKDIFYIDSSRDTKLSVIRKYSEIIVRRILNIGSDRKIMLGSLIYPSLGGRGGAKEDLDQLDRIRRNDLLCIINKILPIGNDATHTKHTQEFTDEEYKQVLDGLFDLLAYQLVDYFKKYPMKLTSPNLVMRDFSLLPPIIRYKTLDRLLLDDPNNIQILNRFVLAMIKTRGKEYTYRWLENKENQLKSIPYPTCQEIEEYILTCGVEVSPGRFEVSIKLPLFSNIYDLLRDKVDDPNTSVNEKGKLYRTFEDAVEKYSKHRSQDATVELIELHSIMDFVYSGRITSTGK